MMSIFSRWRSIVKTLFGWDPAQSLHETAWLDGVRGTAAFLVMLNHFDMEWLSPYVEAPWGAVVTGTRNPDGVNFHQDGERLWAPWRLPLLRVLMVSGSAQVAVFFVLSGIVLSWSPLRSVHAHNGDKLHRSLSSSVIRRWFRLFLPCIIVGLFYFAHRAYIDYHGIAGVFNELWHYITATEKWANPLETAHSAQFSTNNEYSFVMWTIPFEYGGSMFVYVCLLGLGRIQSPIYRIPIMLRLGLYAMTKKLWGFWLFGFGLALSDYVQCFGGFQKLADSTSRASAIFWSMCFLLSIVGMGWVGPTEWFTAYGYEWTASIPIPDGYRGFIGEDRYWHGWSGFLLMLSAAHLRLVQKFYELSFIQYLGRLSFMLYLIHFWVNTVVAQPLRHWTYNRFCNKAFNDTFNGEVFDATSMFNIGAYLFLLLVNVPIVFILSNFLEIWVDRPCTAFGKWMDNKLTGNAPVKEEKVIQAEEQHHLLYSDLEQGRRSSDHAEIELGRISPEPEVRSSVR